MRGLRRTDLGDGGDDVRPPPDAADGVVRGLLDVRLGQGRHVRVESAAFARVEGDPTDLAQQVNDVLDEARSTCPRLMHGVNDWTWSLVADAFRRGHDTRVGFEDSVLLPDGTRAESNAQLVEAALALQAGIRS